MGRRVQVLNGAIARELRADVGGNEMLLLKVSPRNACTWRPFFVIHGAGADGAVDAVAAAADRKHEANDAKCDALGWQCVPLAVDSYGRWGVEAHKSFAQIATHIQTRNGGSLSAAYSSVYNTLGVCSVDSS